MSLYEERKRLEQEDGEPLHTVRLIPDLEPAQACAGAGVVVVAGEWGLTPEDEARFLRPLVELGFFVVGIDVVRGERAASADEAARRAAALDYELAIHDVAAALLYLKEVASGLIGVIGLDVAGAVAIEAATVLPQIDAVVVYGGPAPRKGTRLARTRSSMVIHRSAASPTLTAAVCAEILERIRLANQSLLAYAYDASEGFGVRPCDDAEREEAEIAFDRTRDFLQQHLLPQHLT